MTKKPSYRFGGYTAPWVEKKLGEVSTITMGQSPNSENYTDNPNDYILVQGNADMKNGRVFPRVWTTQITKQARQGDLILSVRAPVGDIGKTDYDVVLGRGVASIDGNEFLYQALSQMKQNGYWSKLSTGSTFESINSNDIKSARISLPSLPEQTAIGSFFQDIDQLISLQQRKLEVLKEQKKTYLKLLFPAKGQTKPALRFAGFEDDWKEVKLGEVLKKNNKKNRDLAINNVESVSNKLGFVKQTEQFEDYSVASADLSNYYVISEKQFAYNPSRINVGSIAYKKEGDTLSVVSPLYISFSTVENIDDSYLWYWFKTSLFDSQRAIYSEGGVRDTLSFNQLSDIELIFPSLPEQEAIGSFFQDLDKVIAKQEEKVNQLKESKQTLLRKMFI